MRGVLVWLLAISLGLFLGIGGFTFRYAEGLAYLSTDPKACVNCHIMRPEYDGWQKSSHHIAAGCVDCHLPHSFIEKYLAKAENGWRHSKKFTEQDFEEPIRVQAAGRKILQHNCVTCHEGLVHRLGMAEPSGIEQVDCVHCHATVGHGDFVGLGGPYRRGETESPVMPQEKRRAP